MFDNDPKYDKKYEFILGKLSISTYSFMYLFRVFLKNAAFTCLDKISIFYKFHLLVGIF